MVVPGDADTWVYRRDPALRAARSFMVGTAGGVPYLGPHGVLLFKAKYQRDKDEADFDACSATMDEDRRAWLACALQRFHPGHPWIDRLLSAGETQ